jgi:hypothetical protein
LVRRSLQNEPGAAGNRECYESYKSVSSFRIAPPSAFKKERVAYPVGGCRQSEDGKAGEGSKAGIKTGSRSAGFLSPVQVGLGSDS